LRAEGVRYEKGELRVERLLVNGQGYGLTGALQGGLGLSGRFSRRVGGAGSVDGESGLASLPV
jgi:hypothetical protein